MEPMFEDAASIDYALTQKYPFYSFYDGIRQSRYPLKTHWHYYVEILYATKGNGKVIVNGYNLDFEKGDIMIFLPGDVHTFTSLISEDYEYVVIKFDPDMLFDSPKEAFAFKYLGRLVKQIPPSFKLIKANQSMAFEKDKLITVHELFYNKPYRFEWMVKSYLMAFFHEYTNDLNNKGYPLIHEHILNEDLTNIIVAFEYINEHFREDISAKDVAEHCHLSYSYFSRHFKKIAGIPFSEYLNFLRITEAERLLLDQHVSITDISYAVGFTDPSYFIKQFKKFKKFTPKQFVKLVRDGL